jgi:hypothetical protein
MHRPRDDRLLKQVALNQVDATQRAISSIQLLCKRNTTAATGTIGSAGAIRKFNRQPQKSVQRFVVP